MTEESHTGMTEVVEDGAEAAGIEVGRHKAHWSEVSRRGGEGLRLGGAGPLSRFATAPPAGELFLIPARAGRRPSRGGVRPFLVAALTFAASFCTSMSCWARLIDLG